MSTVTENNNTQNEMNSEIITITTTRDFSYTDEGSGFDLDLNQPIITNTSNDDSPPRIGINPLPISEVSADNNCLKAMEECQDLAPASDTSLDLIAELDVQVYSSNDEETVELRFNVNAKLDDENEQISCSEEESTEASRPIEFAFADNIPDLPSTQLGLGLHCLARNNIADLDLELRMSLGVCEEGSRLRKRKIMQVERRVEDDGYRWRKYGEKIMKENIYPRAYFRCSNDGCNVKKQVEREFLDSKYFNITYVGEHNHARPPARSPTKNPDLDEQEDYF